MYHHRAVAGSFQFSLFISKPSPHFDHAITKNRGVRSMITPNTVFQQILASKTAFAPSHPTLQVAEFTQPTGKSTHHGFFDPHMTHHDFLFDCSETP
jgi:hypothetical protein